LIAETNKKIFDNLRDWETPVRQSVPQLLPTDCRSLVKHLNAELPTKIADKWFGIEIMSIRHSLWTEDIVGKT